MNQDMCTLGFDQIILQLQEQAVSTSGRERLAATEPLLKEALCRARMEETTAAKNVLERIGNPPLAEMKGLEESLEQAEKGSMLTAGQLSEASRFAATVRRLKRYLLGAADASAVIASWHTELPALDELAEEIDRSVREDAILDDASALLKDLRRRKERTEQSVRESLNRVLIHQKQHLADHFITQRNGHFVLPVQRKYQSVFPGRVIDASGKGTTVFMEPHAVAELQQELENLSMEIDTEERRILWALSDRLASEAEGLQHAIRVMTELDVIFARAKLSAMMHAVPVYLTTERRIRLVNARHPLLDPEQCVPLNFHLETPDLGVAVTGPNTGGKTVCLKTVGLLTLMAQSGLHIPCEEESEICLTDGVYCDIGDTQSISQNLSTFSGHMTNVIRILKECSRDSLVLLDEPGSGTDPAEGSGLAAAILEELLRRHCFFMVTTHDPQIKQWAIQTENVVSARMAFDRTSLNPLYRLELGLSGESCAIEIAKRLGMPGYLLERARAVSIRGIEVPARIVSLKEAPVPGSRLEKTVIRQEGSFFHYTMGDSVEILPDRIKAIVYRPADDKGNVIVQLPGEKRTVKHNRLRLLVPAAELYPPDYDFSIIFDTVANRKAAHQMARKYDPNAVIVHE